MKTVTICIGNSDDKLRQEEWHDFVLKMNNIMKYHGVTIYFYGFSNPDLQFQNACWVIGTHDDVNELYADITVVRKRYNQDSVAVVCGDTQFI